MSHHETSLKAQFYLTAPQPCAYLPDAADGILLAYLPGNEGGLAIADVIFGDVNPSGKLPHTYPKYASGFVTYDHKNSETYDVQWPFGHGLSYTTFEYSNLTLSANQIAENDSLVVSIDIANTGNRIGKETVQLYLSDLVRSVTPPVKQLKRFVKTELKPGEKITIRFTLNPQDFSFIGRDNNRIIEPGLFKVAIGQLAGEFTIK